MESSVGPYRPTQTHMRIALMLVGGSESSNIICRGLYQLSKLGLQTAILRLSSNCELNISLASRKTQIYRLRKQIMSPRLF